MAIGHCRPKYILVLVVATDLIKLINISMRAHSQLPAKEYLARLLAIKSNYPSQSIHFHQLLQLLHLNGIKFYCKGDLLKLSRLFNNPLRLCRIEQPLTFLQLASSHVHGSLKYFIVTVTDRPLHQQLLGQAKDHNIKDCVAFLLNRLQVSFGSNINWFRGLGASPIAIAVDREVFAKNVARILRHTTHERCRQPIVSQFLLLPQSKQIQFSHFIKLVRTNQRSRLKGTPHQDKLFATSFTLSSPKSYSLSNQKHCLQVLENRVSLSAHTKNKNRYQNSAQGEPTQDHTQSNKMNRKLSLSVKTGCHIHDRRVSDTSTFCSSGRPTSMDKNRKKINHRRFQTQQRFFQKPSGTSSLEVKEQTSLFTQSNELSESLKCGGMFGSQQESDGNKAEEYVVLLENQSGVQIEI